MTRQDAAIGFLPDQALDEARLAGLRGGLLERPRRLSPAWFYDERGSALFERICELPEYYPTRIELALSSMVVAVVSPTRATAQFRQRYAADSYRDVVLKRLTLSREGELWKIVEERVIEP